jgi:hypothetical protein
MHTDGSAGSEWGKDRRGGSIKYQPKNSYTNMGVAVLEEQFKAFTAAVFPAMGANIARIDSYFAEPATVRYGIVVLYRTILE